MPLNATRQRRLRDVAKRGRRRGRRGDGSIVERDGRYLARWSHTEGGIRRRESKTFTLRNDAEWWLGQAKRHGEAPDDPFIRDFMSAWLAGKREVSPSTRTMYESHVVDHIIPALGGFRLGALRQRHVQAFVGELQTTVSEKTHRPLSPAMVGKILGTLRQALGTAVPRDIPDNPAAKVKAPRVHREPIAAMTPDDAAAIIAAVKDTWLERIVRVLLGSGLRVGEAVALNQGDVHPGWVGLRKSKTTIRAVRLSVDADAAIHDAIRSAPRRGKAEPVFFSPRHRRHSDARDRLAGSSVSHALPKVLEAAGLSRLTPHGLRHGTATLMVGAGVHMRVVAEQLGHANPAMTARTYAHVAPESQIAALAVLDEVVKG